ncbi:hypothetical protein EN866_19355 [Mesorhizobium sp. M2D.F.Ca.ET.223.01.1.1]|uniref:hypothetical protein n=1 Tax=unclassified Mesorhizobium TaxID=325217 RepID=UPI000FC9C391|nr:MULTISPECIES: hypothetical protein [unclassified Mesorhizobium]TGP89318.1 hypothetical protein EN864_19365 [bacterium M00.F.Ca.ET.221.01.1.1]TGP94691.1 hypothetical protein EN865_15235 [bacterium M00.F.Ca.ET.222.01.1.1]RVD58895.1 hypothetical protein EN783_14760 [Mesorhizobium sp. M2D.F.Ca.ET.140.01.1.1]TGP27924.1 hypothetical protein EN875_033245 [Mesorhizobium sp. M2D.F.Ca.ET.232.01.1.1]TGP75859.1 hypothetical protein EN867_15235 [Mesorhizobium sp. M2D.F.Ca.ET.224.01.1.1]
MILEFYFQTDSPPPVYDFFIDREGNPVPVMPPPKRIDGVRQFVLEGSTLTTKQVVTMRDALALRPGWIPLYFFDECPF